jgi:hypothetical protein
MTILTYGAVLTYANGDLIHKLLFHAINMDNTARHINYYFYDKAKNLKLKAYPRKTLNLLQRPHPKAPVSGSSTLMPLHHRGMSGVLATKRGM